MKASTLRFYKERLLRVLVHIQQQLDTVITHFGPYNKLGESYARLLGQ